MRWQVSFHVIMAIIFVFYLIAGCLLDIFAIMIVSLPIFFTIVATLGFDPVLFRVLSAPIMMSRRK